MIEVGHGDLRFCAAHTGLHADGFEPLHGHTYTVEVRLGGELDSAGMVIDFGLVKAAVRTVIEPLHRRTLVATAASGAPVEIARDRVVFGDGTKLYQLPGEDVVLLPIVNTSTEAIAGYLMEQLERALELLPVPWVELRLAETPGVAAIVRRDRR